MSPASKSKSKDKKAAKESQNASVKLPASANAGSGVPASAYNPLLGTFHTLDAVPEYSAPSLHVNSRFRNIDDTDEHSGTSFGTGPEYDSVSNNGSWSGESEDHKEKVPNTATRQETIQGADNDKREKIRQKNERKHRRQKERRAQELHERCSGYLMSRKLESLAQQLVAMGISSERATMALILNEGRVEESVTWLFEGHEEADEYKDQNNNNGNNLKLDISEELARIADMEIRYKCSKQEVERAIVSCEGDLDKAAETLRVQKHDMPSATEENGDPPKIGDGRLLVAANQNMLRPPQKLNSSSSMQHKRDELNFGKSAATVGTPSDLGSINGLPSKKIQPKLDWVRPQQIVTPSDKRWLGGGPNLSVSSYPLISPVQVSVPTAKMETRYVAVGSESRNIQPGAVREPVVMMQRPKSFSTEQALTTSINSSPQGRGASWHPSTVEIMKTSGMLQQISCTRSLSPNSLCLNQLYLQNHHQHQPFNPGCSPVDFHRTNKGGIISWSRSGSTSTVAAASSLGLFSGVGSGGTSGSSSPMDWNTGSSTRTLDYSSIDWSLDRGLSSSKPNGLWFGLASSGMNPQIYESDVSGVCPKPSMRLATGSNGISIAGLQGGGESSAETSTATSPERTSPFEGQDIFSLPRQSVSSPSL